MKHLILFGAVLLLFFNEAYAAHNLSLWAIVGTQRWLPTEPVVSHWFRVT